MPNFCSFANDKDMKFDIFTRVYLITYEIPQDKNGIRQNVVSRQA